MDSNIDLLLNKRDYDFNAMTRKVIEKFADKLEEATKKYFKMDRRVAWYKVERFSALEGFLMIFGDIEIKLGDTVQTETSSIVATESNIRGLRNNVRFILNAKVLQVGTVEAIYQHIQFVETLAKEVPQEDAMEILRNEVFSTSALIDNPKLAGILEKMTRPSIFESFNTEELSEAQFNTLRMATSTQTKTQH